MPEWFVVESDISLKRLLDSYMFFLECLVCYVVCIFLFGVHPNLWFLSFPQYFILKCLWTSILLYWKITTECVIARYLLYDCLDLQCCKVFCVIIFHYILIFALWITMLVKFLALLGQEKLAMQFFLFFLGANIT